MCDVMGIVRSSFYKALNKSELPGAKENEELKVAIHKIYHENKGRYGSPKVHQIMIKQGYVTSEKRVQKQKL